MLIEFIKQRARLHLDASSESEKLSAAVVLLQIEELIHYTL